MKKYFYLLIVLAFCNTVNSYPAQGISALNQVVKPTDEIGEMYQAELYQDILDKYLPQQRNLSAEELSYVSLAYSHLGDYEKALYYADLAVKKNSKFGRAYYAKAFVYNISEENTQALDNMKKAIELSPANSEFYTALGDIYFTQENYNDALENFRKAVKQKKVCEKAYYMIGATHANMNNIKNALDTFYVAKSRIVKDKELYVTVLYNIAKLEYDSENYMKAHSAYSELVEYFPDDYYSHEKIVECCNSVGDFSHSDASRAKLQDAYKKEQLKNTPLSDKFCIGNFTIEDKEIVGYERYEEPAGKPFVKYIYYVTNDKGNVESTIKLEYIPSLKGEIKGSYKPVMEKDGSRYTYAMLFDESVKYSTLQPYIADIVSGEVEVASKE